MNKAKHGMSQRLSVELPKYGASDVKRVELVEKIEFLIGVMSDYNAGSHARLIKRTRPRFQSSNA
jgi:hypothetical protein